jgi:hypothetical protein
MNFNRIYQLLFSTLMLGWTITAPVPAYGSPCMTLEALQVPHPPSTGIPDNRKPGGVRMRLSRPRPGLRFLLSSLSRLQLNRLRLSRLR